MHSVLNTGQENRIYLVMDFIFNVWVLELLPAKNASYFLHQRHFILLGICRVFKYYTNKDLKIKDFIRVIKNSLRLMFLIK
jgi:hypothetical protein